MQSWILSRRRQLSNESRLVIDEIINSIPVLNHEYYIEKDHSDEACFYYPEVIPGQPVSFRGQCDENIEVVTDFELENVSL